MKKLIFFGLVTFIYACQNKANDQHTCGWQKVFANNENGETVFGDKTKLVDAVRLGYPVRIGFGGKPVEHVADAHFLTIIDGDIIKGEVFAQIPTIVGQNPTLDGDTLKMRFRASNHWTKMSGTNGYTTAFMTDYQNDIIVSGNNDKRRSTTWYVEYPCLSTGGQLDIEAKVD